MEVLNKTRGMGQPGHYSFSDLREVAGGISEHSEISAKTDKRKFNKEFGGMSALGVGGGGG